jgi:hypothetical protein
MSPKKSIGKSESHLLKSDSKSSEDWKVCKSQEVLSKVIGKARVCEKSAAKFSALAQGRNPEIWHLA